MALSSSGDHDTRPWILGRLDANSAILEIEGKVRELIGRPPAEVIGQSPVDLMHPDSTGDSVSLWWRLMREPGSTATSRRCFVHPDGTEIWAEQTYLNRFGPEGKGDVLWMAHDITERRAQEQELRESHE